MQGVVGAELRYSGMWSCFKDIVKTESVSYVPEQSWLHAYMFTFVSHNYKLLYYRL